MGAIGQGPSVEPASRARLDLLRAYCAEQGIDVFSARSTSDIAWLTAFEGVFDDERAHMLAVGRDTALLHTDSRYGLAARQAAAVCESAVQVSEERVSHARSAVQLLAEQLDACSKVPEGAAPKGADGFSSDAAALGIEDDLPLNEYRALVRELEDEALDARIVETHDAVVSLRAVKDEGELARLRAAQAVTDAAFDHIVGFMRPGMTERKVQIELEDFMVRNGAEGLAFSSIVACGANGASAHAIPGSTKLESGQCVVLDFGARARGYCSDMTRMVFLGEPDAELRYAYEVLRRANEGVEAALRPGMTGREAHELAERILEEGGFAGRMGHGLGHGVGIDVHELPVLSPRNESPLVAGNVVTVEPGIYLPGRFGMRLEDCGVVTDEGYKVFGRSTHDMVII